ncbi:glycosyltransferase family 4 protein [Phaeodactylibacter xiamenensis]|uniref:glycosyltransferase family 4 protein n=1 Tax=Phaeodactylibacter xiamenensis TaxID=1524460 RepID=UPI0024A88698|nr:glycosyltransferase family 4 protein [Phaeodactylibacter xiamenensis]
MKITWVTRSFLDYRIPIYKEINRLTGDQLTVIYYSDVVPDRCAQKLEAVLGDRAIGLSGELRIGGRKTNNQSFANQGGLRIPLQPGLVKKVRATQPELLLSDGFFQWTYAPLLLNAVLGIPHIMLYERTLHTERNASALRVNARKLAGKFIDAIGCNGTETFKYLRSIGIPEDQLFIGNMAPDSEGLEKEASHISDQEIVSFKAAKSISGPIFLYVGQLIERKGIHQMLDAWKSFSDDIKDPTLVLIGGGEQEEELKQKIEAQAIHNVRLLGRVDYSEVAKYYKAADVFLISTLEDNWSLVVPEAMSCALPVACSKYNGCWPELVKPENGWVFDPLDQHNFVATLREIWDRRAEWESMGEASKAIIKNHTPEKVAQKIYTACLNAQNR